MAFDKTLSYLTRIEQACTQASVVDELMRVTSEFGFDHVLAGIVPRPGTNPVDFHRAIMLRRWPTEWSVRYVERRYFTSDPVMLRLTSSNEPFAWGTGFGTEGRVINEAADFGLVSGFAIPFLTLEGDTAALSLAGRNVELGREGGSILPLVACFALGRVMRLRQASEAGGELRITPRERECLAWAAAGKTEWETATILGISGSTVDKHLVTARRKLGAVNRAQAVAEALRRRLID